MQVSSITFPTLAAPGAAASAGAAPVAAPAPPGPASGMPFGQLLAQFVNEANVTHENVNQGVQQLILGETDNIQALAISVAEADLAFRFVMEVRDKLIAAYQEVMRMQV